MTERLVECEYVIAGRVQMVMFRDFAARKARELGINGFVRNNDDGTVTVVAQGSPENLLRLEEYLKEGPVFAKVEEISKKERPIEKAEKTHSDFEIAY